MKNIRVVHVKTHDQAADIFTKALAKPLFENCKQMLGMKDGRDLKLREDVERSNSGVSNSKHEVSRQENSKTRNPKSSSPKKRIPRHAREYIPKGIVRGDEMENPKAEKPRGKIARQETSRRSNPKRSNPKGVNPSIKKDSREKKPNADSRLNKPVFEVGECSGTNDDSGRVIKGEESAVEETEGLEIVSEHEMLRKLKRKPKSKEKCYRDKMCSGHQTEKVLGKKDAKDKVQTALTAAEKKPKL